jgi:thiol-disulfide isomerase/thioredoxin
MAAAATPLPALADDTPPGDSPIAHGILSKNAIATTFVAPTQDTLPDVMVDTPDGAVAIGDLLKGRTVLMPIWAEWCVPCLVEIPDFARLQQVYGKNRFAIIPVLSMTRKKFTPELLGTFFRALNATAFMPILEHHYGDRLLRTMARKGSGTAIPCNVLIAPSGKIVAREIGLDSNGVTVDEDPHDKYSRADRAVAGQTQSLWGMADGDAFASAMENGFLDGQ